MSMRCRQTFRGHVDSVNFVTFQPFSNNVLTAAGDKTISLWDLRSGLCVQTFYGHANACNHAMFNLKGDTVASCDADGIVKMWDVRVVSEFLQIDTGRHPANAANFDRSGKILAIAQPPWLLCVPELLTCLNALRFIDAGLAMLPSRPSTSKTKSSLQI